VKIIFSNKKYFLKTHNMAWNIQISDFCSVIVDVHAQFAFKTADVNAFKLIVVVVCNHIDLKCITFYIQSFVHQSCWNYILNFKFFKKAMNIFVYFKKVTSKCSEMLLIHLHYLHKNKNIQDKLVKFQI